MVKWEQKLDISGPIKQAERCLDQWLKEENRSLPAAERQRVAALVARYFYHEDEVTDQLILSFLRHYSNGNVLDMEDPASVRMEIKSVLDQSRVRQSVPILRVAVGLSFVALVAAGAYGWNAAHEPITRAILLDLYKQLKYINKFSGFFPV